MEIVGRHHDPFTVMEQFGRPITRRRVFAAGHRHHRRAARAPLRRRWPRTTGWSFSAFHCLPLPRTCLRVIWRSRRRARRSRRWPTRSPRSIWRTPPITLTSRRPSGCRCTCSRCGGVSTTPRRRRSAFLAPRRSAVTLSNFYGGLIAAVITPVAVAAYWLVTRRTQPAIAAPAGHHRRRASCSSPPAGSRTRSYAAGAVVANRAAFAFPRADLFRYSAKWWSYLVPPVEHPLLGATAHRVWTAAGVREGLLEQQVSLGWGIVALGLIAVVLVAASAIGNRRRSRAFRSSSSSPWPRSCARCRRSGRSGRSPSSGLPRCCTTSCRCSGRTRGSGSSCSSWRRCWRASGWIISAGPGRRRAQIACLALVALAAGEYAVSPSALWRDVLPTTAHRWVTQQPGRVRVLDCTPLNQESASVQWLTGDRVTLLGGSIERLHGAEPVRRSLRRPGTRTCSCGVTRADGPWFAEHAAPDGLRVAASFDDGQVFAVTAPTPAIYTATMTGFFPREHDAEWSWRWMGADAAWTIVNTSAQADRRHPRPRAVGVPPSAPHGAAARRAPGADARRRAVASHLPDRSAHRDARRSRARRFIRLKRRRWPAT